MESKPKEWLMTTYPVTAPLLLGNEILMPRDIVKIDDLGLVLATKPEWAKGEWVEAWSGDRPTEPTTMVRKVMVTYKEPDNHGDHGEYITYLGEKAEAVWNFFSKMAIPLLDVTLDNQT